MDATAALQSSLPLVTWAESHGSGLSRHDPIIFTIPMSQVGEQRCFAPTAIGANWKCDIMTWLVFAKPFAAISGP